MLWPHASNCTGRYAVRTCLVGDTKRLYLPLWSPIQRLQATTCINSPFCYISSACYTTISNGPTGLDSYCSRRLLRTFWYRTVHARGRQAEGLQWKIPSCEQLLVPYILEDHSEFGFRPRFADVPQANMPYKCVGFGSEQYHGAFLCRLVCSTRDVSSSW